MTPARIPMLDLSMQTAELRAAIDAGLRAVVDSGRFVLGPCVAAFERAVAERLGVRHAIGCGSGTDALHLALRAAGIGPGDEVITSPFTFFGTVEAILHCGARVRFVDIEPHGFTLDVAQVEAAIGPSTRAILPVHLFGLPADMPELRAIAERHRLRLIEDCAQAFGARVGTREVGALGDAAGFSFFPSKNLGGFGDGGMVTTDDDALADCVRELGNHGARARYHHVRVGFTSRLDEMQAAVLSAKLPQVDRHNAERRRLAALYDDGLAELDEVRTPLERPGSTHVYNQYTVLVRERDRLALALAEAGIDSAVHYPRPLHRQPALLDRYGAVSLPVAERTATACLSLPIYPGLAAQAVDRVVDVVRRTLATRRPIRRALG